MKFIGGIVPYARDVSIRKKLILGGIILLAAIMRSDMGSVPD